MTLKLYASSRRRMFAPMKVKMGMMLCRTFSYRGQQRVHSHSLFKRVKQQTCVGVHAAQRDRHCCVLTLRPPALTHQTHREDGRRGAEQQQSVVVRLWDVGGSDALNHQLHAELVLLQNICKKESSRRATSTISSTNSAHSCHRCVAETTHPAPLGLPLAPPCCRCCADS